MDHGDPDPVDAASPPEVLEPAGRSRRRVAGIALTVAVGAVAIGVGAQMGGADGNDREVASSTRVTAPARDWDAECDNDGDSRGATAAELPGELRYFPSDVPAGLSLWSAGGSIWPDHLGCHHGSVALVLAEMDPEDPDQIMRSVQVAGPSYQERRQTILEGEGVEPFTVRGGEGVWQSFGEASFGTLVWSDPEGGEWRLSGARDRAEALAVAEGLRIDLDVDGPPVTPGDVPDGFEVLWQRPEQEGAGFDEDTSWTLSFEGPDGPRPSPYAPPEITPGDGSPQSAPPTRSAQSAPPAQSAQSAQSAPSAPSAPSDQSPPPDPPDPPAPPAPPADVPYSGPVLSIGVSRMSTPTTVFADAWGEARLTEIRGRRGLEQVGRDGRSSISWDEEYGITISVSGSLSLAELRRVAESLRPVNPADPRLTATRG